ncbi:MAG: cbb3-type cytochrome c oxidase subunit I [Candidatus Rokuibacteriota bacterium]
MPLPGKLYSPGLNLDFWDIGLSVAEIAALGAAAELITGKLDRKGATTFFDPAAGGKPLLWQHHHMFTTGLSTVASGFFAAASFLIAIPSGVQVFGWIATLLGRGRGWVDRRLTLGRRLASGPGRARR